MNKRFIINNRKREITNNYEIKSILNSFIQDFPEYASFINSNIRNYIIKKSSCIIITKEQGTELYQKFTNSDLINPEIEIIEQKGKNDFHHLLISPYLIKQLKNLLSYFKNHNDFPKSFYNVDSFLLKSDKWFRIKNMDTLTKEGEIDIVLNGLNTCYNWVLLKDQQAFYRESVLMSNCVRSFFGSYLSGHCQIFSLRNENNIPLVTVEVKNNYILQVKEKYNKLSDRYSNEVEHFIKKFNLEKRINLHLESIDPNYNIIDNLPYGVSFNQDEETKPSLLSRLFSIFLKKFIF